MNWFNLILSGVFVLFAYFQLNDPDPEQWVALYGSLALLWLFAAFRRYFILAIYLLLIISGIWMLSLLPAFLDWLQNGAESIVGSMKAEEPHIELAREFLGLVIVMVALFSLLKKARRAQTHIGNFS